MSINSIDRFSVENNELPITKTHEPTHFSILPQELLFEIFSYLTLGSLVDSCLVNKEWKKIAESPDLWEKAIYEQFFFGNKNWIEHLENRKATKEEIKEDFDSLPKGIFERFKAFCPIFSKKRVKETHLVVRLPKVINQQTVTIKYLNKIIPEYFLHDWSSSYNISPEIVNRIGDTPIESQHWVMMTTTHISKSLGENYDHHKKRLESFAPQAYYQVPTLLEVILCVFSNYLRCRSERSLFEKSPWIYTRCKDHNKGSYCFVGGFTSEGIVVSAFEYDHNSFGVAGLMKF